MLFGIRPSIYCWLILNLGSLEREMRNIRMDIPTIIVLVFAGVFFGFVLFVSLRGRLNDLKEFVKTFWKRSRN